MLDYRKISTRRKQLGLSQQELAIKSDLRSDAISRLEGGRTMNPQLITLEKLAKALRVKVSYFIDETQMTQ